MVEYNDEPGIRNGLHGKHILYMSEYLLDQFREEHGYDLQEKLADLFVDGTDAPATRFDFYLTSHRLFAENFYKPIFEWCADHMMRGAPAISTAPVAPVSGSRR